MYFEQMYKFNIIPTCAAKLLFCSYFLSLGHRLFLSICYLISYSNFVSLCVWFPAAADGGTWGAAFWLAAVAAVLSLSQSQCRNLRVKLRLRFAGWDTFNDSQKNLRSSQAGGCENYQVMLLVERDSSHSKEVGLI